MSAAWRCTAKPCGVRFLAPAWTGGPGIVCPECGCPAYRLDDDEAPVCPVADPGSPEGAAVWRNYDRDEAAWRARRVASRLDDFAGSTLEELRSLSKKEARAPQTVATILALVAEIDRLRKRLEECPPMEFPK